MKALLDHQLTVTGLPPDVMGSIVARLTIPNPAYEQAKRFSKWGTVSKNVPRTLSYAWIEDDALCTYRGFYPASVHADLAPVFRALPVTDKRVRGYTVWPKPQMQPHKDQQFLLNGLEDCLARRLRPYGGLLFLASTAVGKTIFQIEVARRLGHRALILCPTEQIILAWYSDLLHYLGLRKNQIGLIRQSSFKLGKVITLASVATLAKRKERWPELNAYFGTIVVDEVQLAAAPSIMDFLTQSPAKWHVGATATETRMDKFNHAMRSMFGPPIAELHSTDRETVTSIPVRTVNVIETDFEYEHQEGNLRWDDLMDNLALNERRNRQVIDNVLREYKEGRCIVLTTKSTGHVEVLMDMLSEAGIPDANRITGATNADRQYTQALINAVRTRKCRVIVATSQAIKIGANIPPLDSLHVLAPFASRDNLEQLIGRIRRKARGKKDARVNYYLDVKVPYLQSLFRRIAAPVFRKCKARGFENLVYA